MIIVRIIMHRQNFTDYLGDKVIEEPDNLLFENINYSCQESISIEQVAGKYKLLNEKFNKVELSKLLKLKFEKELNFYFL